MMAPLAPRFACYQVRRDANQRVSGAMELIGAEQLPAGDVVIEVEWSSLNYKDALAAQGHPGVARRLPHVPGIDAAGRVVSSQTKQWRPGQQVLVTGYELGAGQWGGWSRYISVPASWVIELPRSLTPREAMIYGTAGFTAAQCVRALRLNGVHPEAGPIVVTGATGGVGCLAVGLLRHLGYEVVASSGKPEARDWLLSLGAQRTVTRDEVLNAADKPLATVRWAGGVDTVGGATLASLVRATGVNGCIAACGMVGGSDLSLSVFPMILRGVVLAGITSQNCPVELRQEIWRLLAGDWRLGNLEDLTTVVGLDELQRPIDEILAGRIRGRVLVHVAR